MCNILFYTRGRKQIVTANSPTCSLLQRNCMWIFNGKNPDPYLQWKWEVANKGHMTDNSSLITISMSASDPLHPGLHPCNVERTWNRLMHSGCIYELIIRVIYISLRNYLRNISSMALIGMMDSQRASEMHAWSFFQKRLLHVWSGELCSWFEKTECIHNCNQI